MYYLFLIYRIIKQFFAYISTLLYIVGCTENAPKETNIESNKNVDIIENKKPVSEKESYTTLILEKLQEHLDNSPADNSKQEHLFSIKDSIIKKIELIEPFKATSDTSKTIKTKVFFTSETDTILSYIITSAIDIEGECIKTISVLFKKIKPSKTLLKRNPTVKNPTRVERFSISDLNFTWEEINACDCLYMVRAKNTSYQKLYFGRLKGDTIGIIQVGKNSEKRLIPLTKTRSKQRNKGSSWSETYQDDQYKIQLKATATQPKVKGKHTYFIDFTLLELSTKKMIKNIVLTNCKS